MSRRRTVGMVLMAAGAVVVMALVVVVGRPYITGGGPTPGTTPGAPDPPGPTASPGDGPQSPAGTPGASVDIGPGETPSPSVEAPAVLLAVGDLATCVGLERDTVARLVMATPGTVALLGDIAYPVGAAEAFRECVAPIWSGMATRLRPVPGNHEYDTRDADPYFAYFGERAGSPGQGWYAYDLGAWRIYALNSNCRHVGGCDPGSPQLDWLAADLADQPRRCSLAYWHHARFSSGPHGNASKMRHVWAALHEAGVDVALAGHDHTYERFAPLDAEGRQAPDGIRSFVVGTGGRSHYDFETIQPGSEVRVTGRDGLLELELTADGYAWRFLAAEDAAGLDAGNGSCG